MTNQKIISRETGVEESDYKWGFDINIDTDKIPKGVNPDIIRLISQKKNEPTWMTDWRLKAFNHWTKQEDQHPNWANVEFPEIDFQDMDTIRG